MSKKEKMIEAVSDLLENMRKPGGLSISNQLSFIDTIEEIYEPLVDPSIDTEEYMVSVSQIAEDPWSYQGKIFSFRDIDSFFCDGPDSSMYGVLEYIAVETIKLNKAKTDIRYRLQFNLKTQERWNDTVDKLNWADPTGGPGEAHEEHIGVSWKDSGFYPKDHLWSVYLPRDINLNYLEKRNKKR